VDGSHVPRCRTACWQHFSAMADLLGRDGRGNVLNVYDFKFFQTPPLHDDPLTLIFFRYVTA
jgi:hypothetical protein